MLKERVKPAENERLPKTADASVAVAERVYKFKLVVENARADKQMVSRCCKPCKERAYKLWHTVGRRCHVHQSGF